MHLGKIEQGVRLILKGLGVDEKDPNFFDTPERVAKAYLEMFQTQDTEWATFPESYNDFVMLNGHRMWTLCPHHLLPVEMWVSLAYLPKGEVLGLSKLVRLLNETNSGPLLQEKFTFDVARKVERICKASGVAVLVRARHGCMQLRGVKTEGDVTTYHLNGQFKEDEKLADRFFRMVK